MRPYNTFGSTEASTSYSSNIFNNSNNSDNNSSSGKRNGATSARKRAERFLHEKAPGVSTLVAGHPEGLLSSSSTNHDRVGRLGLPLKSSSHRHGKNGKRYSKNEVAGLVPDIDGGDELHDPEYEAIKLVERPPPPLTTHSSSNNNNNNHRSSTSTYNNNHNATSNGFNGVQHKSKYDDEVEDSDTTASVVSSTEDEEENGMEAFSPKNRAANLQATPFGSSSTNLDSRRSKPRKTGPSRTYRNYTATSAAELHDPASASAAALSSTSSPYLNARHSNAVISGVGSSTTSSGRLGQNLRSYATTSGTGGSTNFLRPPSVNTYSTGRSSSRRTFADGPATYLAPSITMPPINAPMGEARPEGYNPVSSTLCLSIRSSSIQYDGSELTYFTTIPANFVCW